MPRTPARHTQADIARALRAMQAVAGSAQVEFRRDGTIVVAPALPASPAGEPVKHGDKTGPEVEQAEEIVL